MTVYYTGSGDDGTTGVMGKGRISKDSCMAQSMGDVDELNSIIGVAIANSTDENISTVLKAIQNKLFIIGAELSASIESGARPKSTINENSIKELESEIDGLAAKLPELKKFVLPGGSIATSYLHHARAVARRAERSAVALSKETKINPEIIKYLNRLSSFFFAAALYMNKKEGIEEFSPTY